jgi:aryl-alcohol dehydrogenase-like predicted oxidoreductase
MEAMTASTNLPARTAARLGYPISEIGLGTWQLGSDWGDIEQDGALRILRTATEAGVTVLDTADVYGDGRSERLIGEYLRERERGGEGAVHVFTKMGRRAAQVPESYVAANFAGWVDRSRSNLGMDTLDLVQLHCPPDEVFASDAVFDALDDLVTAGRIARYGVSVETCAQAMSAIRHSEVGNVGGVASVQIIVNGFRQKPLEEVLPAAAEAGVAIIARVPLASGLLSGRFTRDTTFSANDHRQYNRHGEAFDVGETFAGVPFEQGVDAAKRFSEIAAAAGLSATQLALRWILDQPAVTTVIPGASSPEQALANSAAAKLAPLDTGTRDAVAQLYVEAIKPLVHDRW